MKNRRVFFSIFLASALGFLTKAQAVSAYDAQGAKTELLSGKPKQLLIFWATWCNECQDKIKHVLPEKISDPDVEITLINTEKDPGKVLGFLKNEKITLPTWFDTDRSLRKELKVFGVPGWAVLGPSSSGRRDVIASGSAFDAAQINKAVSKKLFKE